MRDTAVRKATNSDDDELQFQNEPSEEDVSDFTSSDIDEEVSDSDDIDEAEMEGRQMNNNWRLERTFRCEETWKEFLAKEQWWTYRSENPCSEGQKVQMQQSEASQ